VEPIPEDVLMREPTKGELETLEWIGAWSALAVDDVAYVLEVLGIHLEGED
jgi:hypothetical protein